MTAAGGKEAGAWTYAGRMHRCLLNILSGRIEGGGNRGDSTRLGTAASVGIAVWEILFCFPFLAVLGSNPGSGALR